jgi:hypothetical protein
VALAHEGRVEITETRSGTMATLMLSRVPQLPSSRLSTASPHSDS